MKTTLEVPKEFKAYAAKFPRPISLRLYELLSLVKNAAPKSEIVISYGMPAIRLDKVLVYFAAYRHHIGFYPTSSGILEFENRIKKYKYSKGAVQFPHDLPLPKMLIRAMVKFRVRAVSS